ncbi:hypothetical protein KWE70_18135, partial [Acinetobacter pittii]
SYCHTAGNLNRIKKLVWDSADAYERSNKWLAWDASAYSQTTWLSLTTFLASALSWECTEW